MALIGEEGLIWLADCDNYTMGPDDAVRAAKLSGQSRNTGHYNTFPLIEQDGAKFVADVEAATDSKGILLQPGESVELIK